MFNLGFTVQYVEGVRLEIISDWMLSVNTTLRTRLWAGCGAVAVRLENPLVDPNTTRPDICILMAEKLKEYLTEDEFNAILEHELAHIRNGDLDNLQISKKMKIQVNMDYEMAADQAAVAKYGAATLLSALTKIRRAQIENLLFIKNKKVIDFICRVFVDKVTRKRLAVLKQAI